MLNQFRTILWYTVFREGMRLVFLVVALLISKTLLSAVIALVLHDATVALVGTFASARAYRRASGLSFLHPMISHVAAVRRRMMGMMFHTNIVSYGRLAETQVPAIAIGAFWGPTEVALFKIGQSAGAALAKMTDPVWQALMPRASRLWTAGEADKLRRLLRHASAISVPGMALIGGLVILFRQPILVAFGGSGATAGSTVLVLACLGQIVNGGLFWNLPTLYACKRASTVTKIYLTTVLLLVPALLLLTKRWGADGAAAALLCSTLVVNAAATWAAVRLLRRASVRDGTEFADSEALGGQA